MRIRAAPRAAGVLARLAAPVALQPRSPRAALAAGAALLVLALLASGAVPDEVRAADPPPPASAPPAAAPAPGARVEARSADLLAVGIVRGDLMSIHLSRIADNAPLHDAAVTVVLRGTAHEAVAEADGSYSIHTPDLSLPGSAAVQFEVTRAAARQDLMGTLAIESGRDKTDDKGTSRQLGWWVLNFGVCIGFLLLWQRRKSAAS